MVDAKEQRKRQRERVALAEIDSKIAYVLRQIKTAAKARDMKALKSGQQQLKALVDVRPAGEWTWKTEPEPNWGMLVPAAGAVYRVPVYDGAPRRPLIIAPESVAAVPRSRKQRKAKAATIKQAAATERTPKRKLNIRNIQEA